MPHNLCAVALTPGRLDGRSRLLSQRACFSAYSLTCACSFMCSAAPPHLCSPWRRENITDKLIDTDQM